MYICTYYLKYDEVSEYTYEIVLDDLAVCSLAKFS